MKRILSLVFLLINISYLSCAQGYRIEVKIDDLRDTTLQLGYFFGEKTLLADTAYLNSSGVAVFKGDTLLHKGIYFLVLPGSYFEMLLGKNQEFSLRTTVKNTNEDLTFYNSPENSEFVRYRKFMGEKQQQMNELQGKAQAQKETGEVDQKLIDEINALDNEVKVFWDETIAKNPGSMLSSIINTLRPMEFPDFEIPDNASNPDSLRWIKSIQYNQRHYFDNIDFSNDGLIRTPFFQGRIDNYFDRVLLPIPDTVIYYADQIIERSRSNPNMFRFILSHLFSKFSNSSIMGLDAAFVHIAEKYFLSGEATWINDESFGKISNRVADLKPNLIGQIAPNVRMNDLSNATQELHKLNANVTVVYFWEPNCSHCKVVTPALFEVYKKFKSKGMQVFAVYTQDQADKWKEYVDENGLTWINVWDPQRVTRYHKLYDIYSTPVIYVLDKNKKIIAKRIGVESLERFIEQEVLQK